jgi:polyribonucleotide nucleotidyltransferase
LFVKNLNLFGNCVHRECCYSFLSILTLSLLLNASVGSAEGIDMVWGIVCMHPLPPIKLKFRGSSDGLIFAPHPHRYAGEHDSKNVIVAEWSAYRGRYFWLPRWPSLWTVRLWAQLEKFEICRMAFHKIVSSIMMLSVRSSLRRAALQRRHTQPSFTRFYHESVSTLLARNEATTTKLAVFASGRIPHWTTRPLPVRSFSAVAAAAENDGSTFAHFHSGPVLQLGIGKLAHHAHASVVATAGTTVVLSTVAREPLDGSATESFLTVEYRQRTAAVGQIPENRQRSDAGRLSNAEILASRAIDRSLRPLLEERDAATGAAVHYHVHTAVQAVDLWERSGHPVSTALNAAAAALAEHLREPVAATVLAVMSDGSIIQDPGPEHRQIMAKNNNNDNSNDDNAYYCVGELLYAGTRDKVVMMEWTSVHESLPEEEWPALLQLAAATLQPILDTIQELQVLKRKQEATMKSLVTNSASVNETDVTAQLRESLGLPPLEEVSGGDGSSDVVGDPSPAVDQITAEERQQRRQEQLREAVKYCRERLGATPVHRLFGVRDITIDTPSSTRKDNTTDPVFLHKDPEEILSKSHRGHRETIMQQEIVRLVNAYLVSSGFVSTSADEDGNVNSTLLDETDRKWLHQKVIYLLLRHALWETSSLYGTRADGRRGIHIGQGWKTVRPVRLTVPALPDAVHGSALFARGDTQVLCTVTLGAPREGQPLGDPYQPTSNPRLVPDAEKAEGDESSFDKLPVGSLRFLRTQEALESDLNSRKVKADKERTGESGSLAEVKRAFLQYDFPAYSTGEVPTKGGIDRRSIGHGALAERAILPLLPDQHEFPYAIRMTSEVTDSNGSSSMASVCGATLALLDAGVPLKAPVAGVSVGLAVRNEDGGTGTANDGKKYSLLLDITGTEDHVSVV